MNSKSSSFLKKKERTLVLMLAPAILTLVLVTVFPLIYLFWTSLHKWEFGAGEKLFILFGNIKYINDVMPGFTKLEIFQNKES